MESFHQNIDERVIPSTSKATKSVANKDYSPFSTKYPVTIVRHHVLKWLTICVNQNMLFHSEKGRNDSFHQKILKLLMLLHINHQHIYLIWINAMKL